MMSLKEESILLQLRKAGAFKGCGKRIWESGASDWREAKAAGQALIERGFVRNVINSTAPGILHLELLPLGVSEADKLLLGRTFKSRLKRINWLGWLTLIAASASAYFAFSGSKT